MASVTGTPIFMYSEIRCELLRAPFSTTIMFATDPVIVRLRRACCSSPAGTRNFGDRGTGESALQQHHRRNIAHNVRQQCDYRNEGEGVVQIQALGCAQKLLRDPTSCAPPRIRNNPRNNISNDQSTSP